MLNSNLKKFSILLLSFGLIIGLTYTTLRFGLSKDNISFPKKDHSHFRIKYIFNGQEENFGSPRYQTDYTKDICNGTLTEAPLHFHDNKTDYQHQHWAKITGGQMLKFYGLNLIGGLDGYMGFKIDKLPVITAVPIYGNDLPKPRKDDRFWVYTGTESPVNSGKWEVKSRNFEDFVSQDFETFFGVESQERKDLEKYGVSNFLNTIKAQAHAGEQHATQTEEQKHLLELGEKANTELLNNQISNSTQNTFGTARDAATGSTLLSTPNPSLTQPQTTNSIQNQSLPNSTSSKIITDNKEVKLFGSNSNPEIDPITGQELKAINNFLGDVVIFVQPEAPTAEQVQARFQTMVKLDKSSCGG